MTEEEWLEATQLWHRFALFQRCHDTRCRKVRLFVCACARQRWCLLTDERSRASVEVAERFADGTLSIEQLKAAGSEARCAAHHFSSLFSHALIDARCKMRKHVKEALVIAAAASVAAEAAAEQIRFPWEVQWDCGGGPYDAMSIGSEFDATGQVYWDCLLLFHDLCGPAVSSPASIGTPVIDVLARAAYENRLLPGGELDPARLAILADALEESGCADDALVAHLRTPGLHVRGCWAVDAILGRS